MVYYEFAAAFFPSTVALLDTDGLIPAVTTGSTATLLVLPHGSLGGGARSLLPTTSRTRAWGCS
jgi:hypothetical protein